MDFYSGLNVLNLDSSATSSGLYLWDEFGLVEQDKVDRLLGEVRLTTCMLNSYPAWLARTARSALAYKVSWLQ